jgi:hypothetical protein
MKINQLSFIGGMTGQYDPTKTDTTQYRVGINCRVRKNALEGAYLPIRIPTPNVVHQSLFALDDKLMLVAGGSVYQVRPDIGDVQLIAQDVMSTTASIIYHENVPAPTNFIMKDSAGDKVYNSAVSALPECAILQDGVTQPYLVASNLANRVSRTFGQWSFGSPEYVPIGLQMCFSGNKLYIASPDGRKIYQSVSGRPLDFVINVDGVTGEKLGDADTTNTAVAAAPTVALTAGQGGGFLAFTYYGAYAGYIDAAVSSYFGEPYIQPAQLFPVGAVSQYGFAYSNGQSVFVAPSGIQSFNQIAQQLRESNNTPFGAPIVDYITRPITGAACCVTNDYIFFGLRTVFGDGILVYDTRLSAYVSIDLVGQVKELAVLRTSGLDRVFFITAANELYEMPLYSGEKATFSVLFGHYCTQLGGTQLRPEVVQIALTDVTRSGVLSCKTYIDNVITDIGSNEVVATTPVDNMLAISPISTAMGVGSQNTVVTVDYMENPYGYSVSFEVTCSAACRLVTFSGSLQSREIDRAATSDNKPVDYAPGVFDFLGNVYPDSSLVGTSFVMDRDAAYVLEGTAGDSILYNGGRNVSVVLREAKRFKAQSDRLTASATVTVHDLSTLYSLLNVAETPDKLFLVGNLGGEDYHTHIWAMMDAVGHDKLEATISDDDQATIAQRKDYMALAARPVYHIVETEYVDFYCCNFPLPTADLILDENGVLTSTPADMLSTGRIARWVETSIAERNNGRFNIVVFGYPPYSTTPKYGPGLAALRWNFRRMGVCAVIANGTAYERGIENEVYYFNVGTGSKSALLEAPAGYGLAVPGKLRLTALPNNLGFDFLDANGNIIDRAAIVG